MITKITTKVLLNDAEVMALGRAMSLREIDNLVSVVQELLIEAFEMGRKHEGKANATE